MQLVRFLLIVTLVFAASAKICKYNPQYSGEGTYHPVYDDNVGVYSPNPLSDPYAHCGLASIMARGNLYVAALNTAQYGAAAYCGACALVTGPRGSVQVRIVDECATCAYGDLDLSRWAFAKIANVIDGRVSITWKFSPCQVNKVVNSTMVYRWKDGSSQYWFQLHVRDHIQPLTRVQIWDGGAYRDMTRQNYNYWHMPAGVTFAPAHFTPTYLRLFGRNGEIITDSISGQSGSQLTEFRGTKNFHNGCSNCTIYKTNQIQCSKIPACLWSANACTYRNI